MRLTGRYCSYPLGANQQQAQETLLNRGLTGAGQRIRQAGKFAI